MKFLRLLIITFITLSFQAYAQDADSIQQRMGQLVERLGLTSEQITQIKPVIMSSMKRTQEILKEHDLDISSLQNMAGGDINLMEAKNAGAALNKIREETSKQLAEFLTPEQMAEFQRMQTEAKNIMREKVLSFN